MLAVNRIRPLTEDKRYNRKTTRGRRRQVIHLSNGNTRVIIHKPIKHTS